MKKYNTSNVYFYKEKCKRLEAIIEVLTEQVEDLLADASGYPSEVVEGMYVEVTDGSAVPNVDG